MIIKGKFLNSYVNRESGFRGVCTNIEPDMLPDGFVPEVTNLTFDNFGCLTSVKGLTQIGSQITSKKVISIFVWKKDEGTNVLLAQVANDSGNGSALYKWTGTSWSSVKTFTTQEKLAYSGGFFDKLYVMHHTDGFYTWDGASTWTAFQEAPRSKYLFLWTGYLFAGGDLYENKKTAPTDYTYAPFRVRWSPIVDNEFNGWYNAYEYGGETVNNFIDFRTAENSNITGMGLWNRRIVIFTKNSIEELYGYQPEAFQVNTIYKGHLSCIDNCIAYYDYVYYLSPDGLCVMGKDAITIGDIYKGYWSGSDTYYSLVAHDGKIIGNEDSDIMLYDTMKKTFEHHNPFYGVSSPPTVSCLYSSSDTLYLGTTNGKIYTWGTGSSYLNWEVKTKEITYGREDRYKRPMMITIMHDQEATTSMVTVKASFDGETPITIGTFDAKDEEYENFFISEPLFKKAQIILSGSGKIKIKAIELVSKIRGGAYV